MPVYQYQGKHYELADGLSPEQALSKIKSHLGQGDDEGFLTKALGVGEGALSAISGVAATIPAGIRALGESLATGSVSEGLDRAQSTAEAATYTPRTKTGKAVAEGINNTMGEYQQEVADKFAGDVEYLNQQKQKSGKELTARDYAAENTERTIGGVIGSMYVPGLRAPTKAIPKAKKGLDLEKFAAEQSGDNGPQLTTRRQGAQGELFPDTSVTETINKKPNTVVPGAASQFDPFQEQSPIQPRSANRQMELPLPEQGMPDVLQQSRSGVGQMLPQDPGFAEAVKRGLPPEQRPMESMRQELQSGNHDVVDFPSNNGMGFVADELRQDQARREQTSMYQDLSRQANAEAQHGQAFDQLAGQEGTAGSLRAQEAQKAGEGEMAAMKQMEEQRAEQQKQSALQEQERQAKAQEAAQEAQRRRQTQMEFEVKRQQTADFNAAERKRQDKAPVPGLDDAHVKAMREFQDKLDAAGVHPDVKAALDKLEQAQQLYIRVADGMQNGLQKMNENILRRLQDEVDHFEQVAQDTRKNIALEENNPLKNDPMPATPRPPEPTMEKGPRKSSPGGKQSGYILLSKKREQAAENLTTKDGIKKILGEMAPSKMTPEQAVEAAKTGKDLDQNALQKLLNNFTKGGLYQALKTHNPMISFIVEKIQEADRKSRAMVRDWVNARMAPDMRALSKAEQGQIWSAIELGDLSQKPLDYVALAKAGATEKQIKLAKTIREAMDFAFEQINKARAAAGKDPIDKRTAYVAMRASGDYRRLVYDTSGEGKKVIGVIGSDYRRRLEGLKGEMEGKGFFVGEERYFASTARDRNSSNAAFMSAVEHLADTDPRVADFVKVLHDLRTSEIYSYLNTKKHTMEKKGVDGMDGRKSWMNAEENAADGFKSQLQYMEAAIKWGNLSEASEAIKPLLDNPDINMPKAKEWSERYLKNALGFNPSAVGRGLEDAVSAAFRSTGVGYSVFRRGMADARMITNGLLLMLNPRFWLTNVVQPLVAMPGMKGMLVARGLDSGFDFGTGYSYLAQASNTMMKKSMGMKLDPIEKAAMSYAEKNHVYGSDLVEHSNQVRAGVAYHAENISNFGAGKIESATRQLAFHSFVHMLRENGMTEVNGLMESAHNLTDMMMNNYSTIDRPNVYHALGPVGDLAVNLQSFKHNELSRLSLFARQVKEYHSIRPLLAHLTSGLVYGGIMGTLAYDKVDDLVHFISKAMGKPTSLSNMVMHMSEGVGKKLYDATGGKIDEPYLLSHGIFSAAGMDMTRSLGITDPVGESLGSTLAPGFSKLTDIAGAAYNMTGLPSTNTNTGPTAMNAKRLLRAAAPAGMVGAVDNQMFTQPNGLALRSRDLTGQAYKNDTDTALKYGGFSGVNEAVQRQKTFNVERESRDYADMREGVLNTIRDQVFSGSVKGESVQKYLDARGSVKTLETDIKKYAEQQHMSAEEFNLMHAVMSKSVAQRLKAAEYMKMFGGTNGNKR